MYSNIEFYDKSESALKQGRIFSFQTKNPNEKWREVFLKPRYKVDSEVGIQRERQSIRVSISFQDSG
jgi:hypothetical protein